MSTRRSRPANAARRAADRRRPVRRRREVVPRPPRDADEGKVALDRHLGDRAQRAVAAGHAENVRLGRARELDQILAVGEHMDRDAPIARHRREVVDGRTVRARVRVHEENASH